MSSSRARYGHARVVDQAVHGAAGRVQVRGEVRPTAASLDTSRCRYSIVPGPAAVSRSASALPSSSRMSAPIDPRALADEDLRLRGPLPARGAGDDDRPRRRVRSPSAYASGACGIVQQPAEHVAGRACRAVPR